jgi:phosphoribosyl-AMP cyclohydrolase
VRPRYGRIAALATSVTVSAVAALAGLGVLATGSAATAGGAARPAAYTPSVSVSTPATDMTGPGQPVPTSDQTSDQTAPVVQSTSGPEASDSSTDSSTGPATDSVTDTSTALPESSGSGRRIVFSQSRQRVWLVGDQPDDVQRTYLVSGSVTHNLQPGTYSVYSRSRWAVGVDDSGVMQYFVRFTKGPTGAAIGFHTIPTQNGVPLQTAAQLGTPQSHGCIRQRTPDAIALWKYAPTGTKVVVVA